jgi:hypothetical protein
MMADRNGAVMLDLNDASEAWQRSREQAHTEANRSRSEKAKAQPRAIKSDGKGGFASGHVSHDTRPEGEFFCETESRVKVAKGLKDNADWERKKLADEVGVSPATAGRVLALKNKRPELFEERTMSLPGKHEAMTCPHCGRQFLDLAELLGHPCPVVIKRLQERDAREQGQRRKAKSRRGRRWR